MVKSTTFNPLLGPFFNERQNFKKVSDRAEPKGNSWYKNQNRLGHILNAARKTEKVIFSPKKGCSRIFLNFS